MPPITIDGARPNNFAATPDSKAPIWLDDIMNIVLIEDMRPRIESGANSCIIVERITMLTLSNIPLNIRNNKTFIVRSRMLWCQLKWCLRHRGAKLQHTRDKPHSYI